MKFDRWSPIPTCGMSVAASFGSLAKQSGGRFELPSAAAILASGHGKEAGTFARGRVRPQDQGNVRGDEVTGMSEPVQFRGPRI